MTEYPNVYSEAANDYATSYAPAGGYRPWSPRHAEFAAAFDAGVAHEAAVPAEPEPVRLTDANDERIKPGALVAYDSTPEPDGTWTTYRHRLIGGNSGSVNTAAYVREQIRLGASCYSLLAEADPDAESACDLRDGSRTPLGTSPLRQSVPAAYEAMWRGPDTPSVRVIGSSRRKGWAPPMAWDDETIDDARVSPRGLVDGGRADTITDLLELAECGESWHQAMVRVGYENEESLKRQLHRSGRYAEVRAAFGSVAA